MTRPALPVIFRTPRRGPFAGQVTAYFPTLPGSPSFSTCTCYAHVGQHGVAAFGYYQLERLATSAEYAGLLAELRGIYERDGDPDAVTLKVCSRWTRHHDDARRAALRQSERAA